ncbi:MAG: carboxypeptidase-like regulatory domain-containing protein [Terracidiphilus sp.]
MRVRLHPIRVLFCALVLIASTAFATASPYRGVVTFGGLPLPGATVTATQNGKTLTAVTDENGAYSFDDLADGAWTIDIEMQCFEKIHADVTVAASMAAGAFEMKLLPVDKLVAEAQVAKPLQELPPAPALQTPPAGQQAQKNAGNGNNAPTEIPKAPEENEQSADGFLVQGSVNNAATSQYATSAAFGNTRSGSKGLYTGGVAVSEENSALDARPFNVTGEEAAKPAYNNFTGFALVQGPLKIPHLMPRGPNFTVSYQWTRNSSESLYPGLVPTLDERSGNLAGLTNVLGQPVTIYNPATGLPYANNQVPVSPVATALLAYYPMQTIANVTGYNYQAPVLSNAHQDSPQFRLDKQIGRKDELYGNFNLQSTRADSVNLFGFVDHTGTLGENVNVHWSHRLKPRIFLFTAYSFARLRMEVTPNFANRINVSGLAGIGGNDQDAANWGPPSLGFTSGFSGMSDGNSAFNRNRSDSLTASTLIYHSKHNITIGGEFRRQEYNQDSQQDPRGAFQFTGAATAGATPSLTTGSDLADFLIGVSDTSSIAFGNANKYLRETVESLYFNDDWRVLPILTINVGARWDYSAPMTELFGRLVNIDVGNGFASAAAVLGSNPVGTVSGQHYPSSLIRPDKTMFQPRIGITWRPIPASTVVIRAGYGLYPDTSVYQGIVSQMVQQAALPNTTSYSVQSNANCMLSTATFNLPSNCVTGIADTFGIDPNFRVGYAQKWNLGVQRDMPFAMQLTATYVGTKGTHGPQEILPNSYPLFEANPCPSCPSGFVYETSGGNSFRNEGQLQLRRRLRSGFAASLAYTYSKSVDDDAYLGGQGHTSASTGGQAQSASLSTPSATVAQNWLDPRAERSLSSFDERHLLSIQGQYTSGQGLEGGTLLGGWRGRALKEWTVQTNLSYGSGLPETPIYPATVPGTGVGGVIRPDLTGAPIYSGSGNAHLNVAAFAAPAAGQWGTAGRFSITGPNQLTLNSQLQRTFRPHGKLYLDVAVNATNILNHPAFSNWINSVTSTQFGQPSSAGAMRNLQTAFHLRF